MLMNLPSSASVNAPESGQAGRPSIAGAWPYAALALGLGAIFAQWTADGLRPFLRFDSGIFLYVGRQLLAGGALYRTVWDHKPPVIFRVNEFGLWAGRGSAAGVLVLDYLLVLGGFAILWRESARLFGRAAAMFGIALSLLLFFDGALSPNLGETISIPLQAAALALLVRDIENGVSPVRAAGEGGLFALLFWTRPNGIGISIVYLAYVLSRRAWKSSAAFAAGALVVSGCIAIPAATASSLADLWFATFTFNQIYAGLSTPGERLHALIWLASFAANHGVLLVVLAAVGYLIVDRSRTTRVEWLCAGWLVLEAGAAAYSGKLFGKNVLPWIAPAAVLLAGFVKRTVESRAALTTAAVVSAFVCFLGWTQYHQNRKETRHEDDALIAQIHARTRPADAILFCGAFPMDTIVLADRAPGSRIFNSVPLLHGNATYGALAPIVLADARRIQPKLIIERETKPLAALAQELVGNYRVVWQDTASQTRVYEHR